MKSQKKMIKRAETLLKKKGRKALEVAKQAVLREKIEFEPIDGALMYFMDEFWFDFLHPALLSIACESVGGDPDSTVNIGAAMVLLAGAADLHDDIIDQSSIKDSKPTVLAIFGIDHALLLGDALLFKGLIMLHQACKGLIQEQGEKIIELTRKAFFKIGSAEASEASHKGRFDISAEEYFNIIKRKVAVAEVHTRIGGILGNGTVEKVDALGHYGQTLGLLMTIRDEFVDMFEPEELRNRLDKECLPLPLLFAFQDPKKKKTLMQLLMGHKMTSKTIGRVLDLVIESKETVELKKRMQLLIEKEIINLETAGERTDELELLLRSTIEDL